jgi:predicted permease
MTTWLQDARFAVRMLVKYPGFTAGAVFSLAIGIAANVLIFSVVNALLLRPLPVEDFDSLVNLHARADDGSTFHSFSYPTFLDIREASTALEDVVAFALAPISWSTGEEGEVATGLVVSGNYFSMLGVEPAVGRFFRPEEGQVPGRDPVVVLSHRLWRSHFGQDPSVIGRPLRINGQTLTVIGVAPEEFHGTYHGLDPALWLPITMQEQLQVGEPLDARGQVWLELTGRLEPGNTVEQAQASINLLNDRMRERYPNTGEYLGIDVFEASPVPGLAQTAIKTFLGVLFLLTSLMLLIACFNVASMLLARATGRSKEIAIRLAMGSGRGRLVQQLLLEVLALFLLAGAVAAVISYWLLQLAPRLLSPVLQALPVDVMLDLRMDFRVLGYVLLVSLAAGLVFGLTPVLQSLKPDVVHELKGDVGAGGARKYRFRKLLIVGQTAASLLLLILAGLLIRGLERSTSIDPGFEPEGVYLMSLDVSRNGYGEADGLAFYDELKRRIEALPGVLQVALANRVPLGTENSSTGVNVPGVEPPENDSSHPADQASVSTDYFQAMQIPLLQGRPLGEQDGESSPPMAVVSEAFARRFWPEGDAVGRFFYEGALNEGEPIQIVGVSRQVKYRSLGEEPRLFVYRPYQQRYYPDLTLHVRTQGDPSSVLQGVREIVRNLDDSLPLYGVMPLTRYIRVATLPHRLAAGLAALLGLIGLLLVSVGLYGLISYSATQRRREMGIRMAVGAKPVDVSRLVLRQGLVLSLTGAFIGLVLAFLVGRAVSGFLFGLSATDPLTFLGITMLLVAVSLVAAFLPARAAARQNPAQTLRSG